jgi:chemotaxis response regulator CheB
MPVGYTELYARKLNEVCALQVIEAQGQEEVAAGTIFVAPAGRHLTFRRGPDGLVRTQLDVHPLDTPHRPAVDVLFQSAAEVYGERVLAVVLTGMGSDGRNGAAWIKARGGTVITEAEDSCVVYGMPRSVVEAGLSDRSAPLVLEAAGYRVIEAEDGLTALERYYVDKPDVVLLDLVMRGMYGLDVLAKLREMNSDVRVIVISADIQTTSRDLVAEAGAAGFLNKPAKAEDVVAAVERALGARD